MPWEIDTTETMLQRNDGNLPNGPTWEMGWIKSMEIGLVEFCQIGKVLSPIILRN